MRLGREIALALASSGYDIAIHYRSSEEESAKTAAEIKAMGRRCEIFKADLLDMKDTRSLIPRVSAVFPECSVLINSASVFENISFAEVTEETFDRDMTINFKVPFFLSKDFSGLAGAEIIINMLDSRVSTNVTSYFVYHLGKKALRDFTLMAARELGPRIRVNGICPGPVLAPHGKDDEYLRRVSADTPLGRPGSPENIITALKYLIENTYVTGECLYVDGGQHLL